MTTADEVPDPSALQLITTINGEVVQQSGTDGLIYDIPALISYITTFTVLLPGDVVFTGTPAGVGMSRTPPLWLRPGDTIAVEIPKIGRLENPVVQE